VAERQRGMGRGLAAILSVAPREEPEELRQIPTDLISPNPLQPRRRFEEEPLVALAESIRLRGVLQPVLVRPIPGGTYELIAGERRWRAAKMAELPEVPAIVRHQEDSASIEVALIENMARENLNPVEEARACAALTEELGLSREEVGARVGRSRVAVSNLIRLLDLPDEALALIEAGELSEGHGRALLTAADHDARRRLARAAVDGRWSVRELEDRARRIASTGPTRDRRQAAGRRALHPDQEAAALQIHDALGRALGRDVDVDPAPGGGYRVHLSFSSVDEALDLAQRVRLQRAEAEAGPARKSQSTFSP
jgi:ParB family transcriptional regulator, chromosome partitioning protein